MSVKEHVLQELARLHEEDLVQVAEFIAFLRYRARRAAAASAQPVSEIQRLYAEAAEEDRTLAEEGMEGYATSLAREDEL